MSTCQRQLEGQPPRPDLVKTNNSVYTTNVRTYTHLHKTSARMSFAAYLEVTKECPLHDLSASKHSSSLGIPAFPLTTTHQWRVDP